MTPQSRAARLVYDAIERYERAHKDVYVGVMLTEPTLKYVLGPDATQPIQEGEEPADNPASVLVWFVDVKLDDGDLLRDVFVPTQARALIGTKGSPVALSKDLGGVWQVTGRADRETDTVTVRTVTLDELGMGFIRGLDATSGEIRSPFYQYTQSRRSVVSEGNRLFRGIALVNGEPVREYETGSDIEIIPLGQWILGTHALGAYHVVHRNRDGSVTTELVNP